MVVIKVYLQRDDSLSALTLAISCCFWFYSRLVVVVVFCCCLFLRVIHFSSYRPSTVEAIKCSG